MNLEHMGCQNVEGLECSSCSISSCGHPYMKTPVSYQDAKDKHLNLDYLTNDREKKMYYLGRYSDGTCIYFDSIFKTCSLSVERRPTACLVFPVRMKSVEGDIRVILSMKCPSAYAMAEAYMLGDQSVEDYVATALILIEQDRDYLERMLEITKDFTVTLDLGSYYTWDSAICRIIEEDT